MIRIARIKNLLSLLAVACGALALAGCSSVNTVERAQGEASADRIADKRVITDPTLSRRVNILNVIEAHAGDLLQIQVEVENRTYSPQDYTYQFVWIEDNGMQVASPAPLWKPGQINGRERQYISAIAPNPRVVDFRLNLLER